MSKDKEKIENDMKALDKIKDAPFGQGNAMNSGVIRKIGDEFQAVGVRDFTDPDSKPIDADTMMGEGSVGKVRFAGLAYMLQQDGKIDLSQNAREFFSKPSTTKFLEKKYPGQNMQTEILKLFSGDNEKATLADLTTHRAGVGDLTRDQGRLFNQKGDDYNYDLPTLLKIPPNIQGIPRDNGRPRAQHGPQTVDKDLPKAEYGAHQYSNLSYALLGVAMEASYAKEAGTIKSYQELTNDYMLHPIEGKAKDSGLVFNDTKFPSQITSTDNVVKANWVDKSSGKQVDANQFNGANSAGGMFTSANDAEKYFKEFFNGFPGTTEYGQEGANKFFTKETIENMQKEWEKFPPCGQDKDGNPRKQGPGFVVTIDKETNEVLSYDKSGGTLGYNSNMIFYPKAEKVDLAVVASENVSDHIANQTRIPLATLTNDYKDENGKFDRTALYQDYKNKQAVLSEMRTNPKFIATKENLHRSGATLSSQSTTNYVLANNASSGLESNRIKVAA